MTHMPIYRLRVVRRGASLIELLLVIGVLVVLAMIVGNMITGSNGQQGVKQKAQRTVQQVNFYTTYQGFYTYGSSNDGKYPSTKTARMDEDTTSAVFGLLVGDGYLAAPQLISPNEYSASDVRPYTTGEFMPENTSFCLNDYDADNWQRYRDWGVTQNAQYVLLSDRWLVDPSAPEGINNIQADVGEPGYWNVLLGDGSAGEVRTDPVRDNGDHLFERNNDLGATDALMVRD